MNKQWEQAIYEWIHIPFNFNEFHKFIDEHNWNYQFIMYDNSANKKDRLKLVKGQMYSDIKINYWKKK